VLLRVITICFTHFKSLALANLAAALYSVRRQDLSRVEEIVVVNNDTEDSAQEVVDALEFPVPVRALSFRHNDSTKTHSWSTNVAVNEVSTPWVLFTRADYLLDFNLTRRFAQVVESKPEGWDGFVTGHVYHLAVDVAACEQTEWRQLGSGVLRKFSGAEGDYTLIDAGVWMARRDTFDRVGGMDEGLTAWGHAQTHFQHKLFVTGVEFVRVPEVLFYHPHHAAPRDLAVSHQQLVDKGIDLKAMWKRYHGQIPY
jgi:glycosyltransferase involved in cell wall biosynthesis